MSKSEEIILYKKKVDLEDSACHSAPLKELAADLLCDKGCHSGLKEWKALASKKWDYDQDLIIPHFKAIEK